MFPFQPGGAEGTNRFSQQLELWGEIHTSAASIIVISNTNDTTITVITSWNYGMTTIIVITIITTTNTATIIINISFNYGS